MSAIELANQFFTHDSRLASFQTVHHKRRTSSANSKAAKFSWPHKFLAPEQLAKAGFYFNPASSNPDNVTCFLCHKSLDGWEQGDDPLDEHVKHSSSCGWAIVAAIEAEYGDFAKENAADPRMIEARKATFADKWPHDSKKGWKCKSKQLVDAGWKFTPTLESDDMVTCTYCQLALDGWEPADKPLNEHYNRAPECPFFTLLNENQGPKKTARGKGARASKVSRLSTQSIATVSEQDSVADLPAEHDDSVLTTTSTMAGKKGGRPRKGTTAKGRKAKAKKEEAVEEPEVDSQDAELPPPPPPKPARGRKRASDAMDDSVLTATEAPAPKKRATRGRASNAVDSSVLESQTDADMTDAPSSKPPAKGKKGRGSTRSTRKASAMSIASTASTASLRSAAMLDDAALDRQLEADLDRALSDDEGIMMDSDTERKKAPAKVKVTKTRPRKGTTASQESNDYAMFDPAPVVPDEAAIDAELKAMEAESQVVKEEEAPLRVPKKGRAAGTRKASKQTKAKKVEAAPPVEEATEPFPVFVSASQPEELTANDNHDDSIASNATVVKSAAPSKANTGKKRGRPAKKSNSSQVSQDDVAKPAFTRPAELVVEIEPTITRETFHRTAPELPPKSPLQQSLAKAKLLPPPPSAVPRRLPEPPSTPGHHISPAQSARQPVVSPSPSPQASDAENQPPSSQPAASTNRKRFVLAPVAATPMRGSPSKRNVIAGLQSQMPWTAVDLDLVFGSPADAADKENARARFLCKGAELTSPEKRMTVEEWIYHNAGQAEQQLKHECETLVSRFETEGTRAMVVLEGLVTAE